MGKIHSIREMTVEEMVIFDTALTSAARAELLGAPVPHSLLGRNVPADLNGLTLDGLEDLALSEGQDLRSRVLTVCRVVLGVTDERAVMRARAYAVAGLIRFVSDECRRVAGLFSALRRDYTPEERAAGIESLNFGLFGLADWYARRMGITDHEEAKRTPWVRIYKCVEMDYKEGEYRRKFAENERKRAEARVRSRRR